MLEFKFETILSSNIKKKYTYDLYWDPDNVMTIKHITDMHSFSCKK